MVLWKRRGSASRSVSLGVNSSKPPSKGRQPAGAGRPADPEGDPRGDQADTDTQGAGGAGASRRLLGGFHGASIPLSER